MNDAFEDRTIRDFGKQWRRYIHNDGYYASSAFFLDILGPLSKNVSVEGAKVADIGSGTGRIVKMLLAQGAHSVTAVEPSDAFFVLKENLKGLADKVHLIHAKGDELPPTGDFDLITSFGVIHHIPEPDKVLKAIHNALSAGGTVALWLYGYEGNRIYLTIALPLRSISTRLPDFLLRSISCALAFSVRQYGKLCLRLPQPIYKIAPLSKYLTEVYLKLNPDQQELVIFDQLNPKYADYYTEARARSLLVRNGFTNIELYNRHGYSWTVTASKGVLST